MALREWPLIAFTLLAQTGVGFFLLFVLPVALVRKRFDGPEARLLLLRALLVVLGLLTAAACLSFFHLGNPANAHRALSNLRNSWLSREIFCELLMMACLALLTALEWKKSGSAGAIIGLYLLAACLGAALIWSMANIYRLESVPLWNNAMTPFSFFMTTLILGALASAASPSLASLRAGDKPLPFSGKGSAVALALMMINLAAIVLFDPNFGLWRTWSSGMENGHSSAVKTLFVLRLIFLVLAGVFIGLALVKNHSHSAGSPTAHPAVWAFVAALSSEALGRTLFYALFKKAGL